MPQLCARAIITLEEAASRTLECPAFVQSRLESSSSATRLLVKTSEAAEGSEKQACLDQLTSLAPGFLWAQGTSAQASGLDGHFTAPVERAVERHQAATAGGEKRSRSAGSSTKRGGASCERRA